MSVIKAFKKDLFRKELIPVKILMFLIYGGQATLYPYFTVHLSSLGVSIEQTSVIFSVQPVIALIVAPMVGMFADRLGNFKLVFCFFLLFSAVSANLLLLVPPIDSSLPFLINLDTMSSKDISRSKLIEPSCDKILDHSNITAAFEVKLSSCKLECFKDGNKQTGKIFAEKCEGDCGLAGEIVEDSKKCTNIVVQNHFNVYFNIVKWENADLMIDVDHLILNKEKYSSLTYNCSGLQCNMSCSLTSADFAKSCHKKTRSFDFGRTFWIYLGIRLVVTLGIGLVNGLFDAASMTIIQKFRADVGYQRFWSTVSMCIFAPISGLFVDYFDGDFRPCFFMYFLLYSIAAVTSLFLDLSMKLPSENAFANLRQLLRNPEVIIMLIHVGVLGICWGFLENYLFLFLEDKLNSTKILMGLTVTVGSGTGLFMALVSTWCTRKLGYVNVMVLAFAAYAVRFVGYSQARDPYVCLIFEMMENFTVTLLTVGVTLYCAELASLNMMTTIMTLWNGLHVISGRAFGSLLGGFLIAKIDYERTFLIFAYMSLAFGTFYALVNILWLKRWRMKHRKDTGSSIRKGSSFSDDSDMENALNQAMFTTPMHCSMDSAILLAYSPDYSEFEMRRRALSHIPATRNSFRRISVIPRNTKSFSIYPSSLSTVMECDSELQDSTKETVTEETEIEVTRF